MFGRKKIAMIVAEFLGTAILALVILAVSKSAVGVPYFVAIAAALTFGLMVLVVGGASGAHLNPAVTLGQWTLRKIGTTSAILYIAAQFLGGLAAWRLYTYLVSGPVRNIAGTQFDWRILVAEALGTFVFTFGLAAAVYQRQEEQSRSAVVGGLALGVGILVASVASNALINPSVALALQSWSVAYVVGPIVGAVVGMNLYAMLFAEPEALASLVSRVTSRAKRSSATRRKARARR